MAALLSAGQHFQFRRVQIFKTESLGIGSYGAVYRAKCDQLPCAAKLLHPILFQDRNPGGRRIRQRFEQECYFLSGIRHPHIVQYLGTCTDAESGLPALLMELMDESLTHFLERSRQPLPYHLEVNLCHDTALALDYLHSNDIIHRDLSSNNVLLVAGSRAKVTDFGMSKILEGNPRATSFTQCPGTVVYMPPEGLKTPPIYRKKLDCFSFGVLVIQIMTRQFPNPGAEQRAVEDARSPVGTINIPIPESERRKAHIDLIPPHHPLLPLALHCLSYSDRDRPTARELCDRLEVLKEDHQYRQSHDQDRGQVPTQIAELQERHHQQLQDRDAALATCHDREQWLREQLERKDRVNQQLTQEKERLDEARLRQIRELNQRLQDNETVLADFQQKLLQREREIEQLHTTISPMDRELSVVRTRRPGQHEIAGATIQLNWRTDRNAPAGMVRGSTAVDVNNGKAYFSWRHDVYEYNARQRQWMYLQKCPSSWASLVMVNGELTAVGGALRCRATNILFSLTRTEGEQTWYEHYPPMPTKRRSAAVICSVNSLVVAGGLTDNNTAIAVEVMNTSSLQWFTASSLPHHFNNASATVCGDTLYLMGGYDNPGISDGSLSVLSCSLTALNQSCNSQTLLGRMRFLSTGDRSNVWRKAADVPVYFTTCVTLCGQVLAVGGNRIASREFEDPNSTDKVYKYDPSEDTWAVISHMPTRHYGCHVAVLPDNELLVVGGRQGALRRSAVVEVGSVL